jgi:hydrogenase-4 component F
VTSRLLAETVVAVPLVTAAICLLTPRPLIAPAARTGVAVTTGLALWLSIGVLSRPETTGAGSWLIIDPAGVIMTAVIAVVGAVSVTVSSGYLSTVTASVVRPRRRERLYYPTLLALLGVLLAVPMAANLAEAWLLVEATTALSALLVGFSGKPRALEAGWKYLILTSLGLGVSLLGIGLLAQGIAGNALAGLTWHALSTYHGTLHQATVAYLLVVVGLAAKIGWAPVHNWLPDAHSEAPPPVSAVLSSALLPAVLLIAWRVERGLSPVLGHTASKVFIAFGLASLAFAVPFLWQPLPWKRLLAYSSLEHMGVIALGFGFASPLAIAGVIVHIVGHAIAKSLGFVAATPLLAVDPHAAQRPPRGVADSSAPLAATMGVSLGALSAIPPSPLFVSELLVLAGGYQADHLLAATAAALLLGLGFLGLSHTLIEVLAGKARAAKRTIPRGQRSLLALTAAAVILLLSLAALALELPDSAVVRSLLTP